MKGIRVGGAVYRRVLIFFASDFRGRNDNKCNRCALHSCRWRRRQRRRRLNPLISAPSENVFSFFSSFFSLAAIGIIRIRLSSHILCAPYKCLLLAFILRFTVMAAWPVPRIVNSHFRNGSIDILSGCCYYYCRRALALSYDFNFLLFVPTPVVLLTAFWLGPPPRLPKIVFKYIWQRQILKDIDK